MPTAIAKNTNPAGHGAKDVRTRVAPVEAATCALGKVFAWMLACRRIQRLNLRTELGGSRRRGLISGIQTPLTPR
jgi:hypothetical protein